MNRFTLSHHSVTRRRSPEVSSTAFGAQPPDLPPADLMDVGFAAFRPLARCRRPHHPVLVHRLAPLLHASFRPRLTTTPLRFAIPSPPSGWEEDLHLPAVEHARHTKKAREASRAAGTNSRLKPAKHGSGISYAAGGCVSCRWCELARRRRAGPDSTYARLPCRHGDVPAKISSSLFCERKQLASYPAILP